MSAAPPGALPLAEASIDQDEGFPVRADGLAHPYWDALGKVGTIGTGLTRLNGAPVTASTPPITRAQNDAAVGLELALSAAMLATEVKLALAPCEWAALANFAFNVGRRAFTTSALLRKLNAGDKQAACAQFAAWDIIHVVVSVGLQNRRRRTAALFRGDDVPGVTDLPGMPTAAERRAIKQTGT